MQVKRNLALGGATIALVLASATAALAAGTTVSVRVEGLKHTLLPATTVQTHAGSITKDHAPPGTCPATSAAGALSVATHNDWGGTYNSKYKELELTSILGESWPFSQLNYYWGVWVNDRFATTGMCEIKLHRGDRVLFAVDSDKRQEHPLGLTAPSHASQGRSFKLKVVSYSDTGVAKPLAGAHVGRAVSNNQGIATVTATHTGKVTYKASEKGYIRSASVTVVVS